MSDWRSRLGVVYSTNPDFSYTTDADIEEEQETLPAGQQPLRLSLSTAHRKGKTVTLITGFVGTEADLRNLAKTLRTKLSTGGTEKDGEIILQGDCRKAVLELLKKEGYTKAKM
jgi:translation initiation factor 1